jgi:hypothetical protein
VHKHACRQRPLFGMCERWRRSACATQIIRSARQRQALWRPGLPIISAGMRAPPTPIADHAA